MNPGTYIYILVAYFGVLFLISFITGKSSTNDTFFTGNRRAPWYIISFGMLGASLSGVTFISVPGWVMSTNFTYMQMVLGYVVGYIVISQILLPIYYKLKLPSIYSYLDERFGKNTYKSGSWFFILSRTIGSSFRLFLMANVLQITIFEQLGISFSVTVVVTILLIWLYTFRSGIKTIIWTDALQTFLLLAALVITVIEISGKLNLTAGETFSTVYSNPLSKIFVFDDFASKQNFFKQFLSGVFITIVMTGLDQDMMQKNLSCRNLKDAQKNMRWYGFAFVPVNFLFLSLGVLLVIYAYHIGMQIPERSDDLFPTLATGGYLSPYLAVIFMLGLVAAAYSSADSALTSLTTSFSVDILGYNKEDDELPREKRILVHFVFSVVLAIIILLFNKINNQAVVSAIFMVAGYTYGPLLGVYFAGLFTRLKPNDKHIPYVMIASPLVSIACYYGFRALWDYTLGFEVLLLNGFITFLGLILLHFINKNYLAR
ncbi:sodium:solute symporter [Saccharicrinis sp. FJH62]|uniref:sodium:solute symporter n=1 Tax=Saccharicrinis sp. FJH62 TaxID=3344657 RepID=UPI0035D487A6